MQFQEVVGGKTQTGGRPLKTVEEQAAEREAAERAAEEQQKKAAKLAAKLRELGVDPEIV